MSWSHPAFEDLARLVSVQTGLDFTSDRRTGAELGIRRAMGRAGINAPARYRDLILADAAALDDMIAELTIGETYFFREPAQFQFIRRAILPEICSRRGDWHVIRAWSACCSSGEEAYSLAMVFSEEGTWGAVEFARNRHFADRAREGANSRLRQLVVTWRRCGSGPDSPSPAGRPLRGRGFDPAARELQAFESRDRGLPFRRLHR